MGIIFSQRRDSKSNDTFDDTIDSTATELLALREFVVTSYEIDTGKRTARFSCQIHQDYAICRRCRHLSDDIHQYKRRCVRGVSCFEWKTFLVFDIRRFRCPFCKKVFTESLKSIAENQRYTQRFERAVYTDCLGETFSAVAKKYHLGWHGVEGIFYRGASEQIAQRQNQYPFILVWMKFQTKRVISNIYWSFQT